MELFNGIQIHILVLCESVEVRYCLGILICRLLHNTIDSPHCIIEVLWAGGRKLLSMVGEQA